MVKVLAPMALLASGAAAAASLTAQIDRQTVALGESVNLTVEARGLKLDALDLAPLAAHFELYARTLSRGTDSETLGLTLYPRGTGILQVPALPLAGQRTAALSLKVSDGSASVPRVTAAWALTPAAPWVNQPSRLTLSLCDDGSLQWQRPALATQAGRVLRALGEDESSGQQAGERCTQHRFHWSLLATQGGAATLELPMLEAHRFGERLRFPGPSLAYRAAALPAWLPDSVPAVMPVVGMDRLPSRWPLQRPLAWRFQVTGGYSADALKALLALQLRESPALGFYPPLIEEITEDDPASPLSRHAVTLFLQPRASGPVRLPTLRLPWYDVARGRLDSTVVAGKTLTVFDPRGQMAGRMAAGLAAVLLLAGLIWRGRRMLRWRRARGRGLHAIRQARDMAGLARALRQFSLTGQPIAPSLGEWQRCLNRETDAADVSALVRQLERQLFGQGQPDLAALQQPFLQALRRVRPRRH